MECEKCKTNMIEISRERVLDDVNSEDITEGQMADYQAAALSGDLDEWGVTEITYKCEKCGHIAVKLVD